MKTASDVNGGTATPATLPTSELGFPDDEINSGDIAVIGLGCRVAGGINSPEQLWDFLLAKGDASGDIPPMRWEPYYSHDARNVKTLKALPSRGYFLKNLEEFDAAFFGTSGREAELMDPQQRISVEVTWEALEDAGIPPQSLVGSDTAVYMGVGTDDYSRLLFENLADIEAWTGIGTAYCGVPNRISYLLDLNGPSFAVDAACASSLVAIHHARQALLSGETSIAIAGGVNALIVPGQFQVLSHAGAISPEGQCMSFDDDAHGYGRGEGVGIVILKRLEDAVRDGDHIQAVLKGSAIGHDGRTNGIMAPNGKAQIQVARDALRAANLEASSISYVEAHATSTPAGDPVETSAISTVYGHGRPESEPCLVGSIKPNIGHLESGAGALGFIKSVLAVNKSFIPPQTNLKKLNSKIDWKTAGIEVVREQREWKQDDKPRRAAICSYGYGGTVSHAIIENAPLSISSEGSVKSASSIITDPVLLLLSAPQAPRLPIAARTLGEWFSTETGSAVPLDVVGNTLALRRGHHAHRVAVVTSNAEEASKLLKSLAEGSPNSDAVATARISPEAANPGPVWVFSGHGAHWKGMGVELMEQDPVFAKTIYDIDTIVQKELDFSVATILKDGSLGTTDVVHVLTFAMQVGLSAVLKSKGVFPSAIIGHSLGETAAAVCAGALTLREATLIVSKKAKLLQKVMGTGAMVLLQIPFEEAVADVGSAEGIAVAIDTSPNSCVVSGEIDVVERFSAAWKERGVNVRKVNSDIAFHSPMLHCLRQQFQDQIEAEIKPQTPTIPLYSTSIPNDPRSQAPRDGKYWADNLINPVLLTSAITAAADDGFRVFLEVSSHPIVCQGIDETLDSCGVEGSVVLPTLLRNRPPRRSVLLCVGKLHCNGVSVDLASIFGGEWSQSVPKTQWKHEAFWKKVAPRKSNQETHDVESHTLLGQRTQLFGTNLTLWQTFLDDTVRPYPNLHPIMGTEIIPAAVLLSTFLKAGETTSIGDIKLKAPVPVMPPRDIQIKLDKDKVQISSRLAVSEDPESQPWTTHTLGQILAADIAIPEKISIEEIKQKTKKTLVPTFAVDYLASLGVTDMGFPWVVTEHLAADNEMLVRVAIAPDVETLPWNSDSLAPFIDAATSVGAAIFHEQPGIRMPSHIDRVSHLPGVAVPREGYIHVKRTSIPLTVDITMSDLEGNVFAEVAAMTLSELEGTEGVSSSMESLVHEVAWPAAPLTDFPAAIDHIIFIGPGKNIIKGYREFLEATTKIKVTELAGPELIRTVEHYEGAVIIFIPAEIESDDQVFQSSSDSCAMLVAATKIVASLLSPVKLYAITQNAAKGATPTALAQGALYGLARIIETEHANIWGALIDVEDSTFPLQAIKYVTGADIIRVVDGVARIGRLRSLPKAKLYGSKPKPITLPTTDGTYVITGGTGDLGLEVASWMIEKGARRLVLVSRRKLPARRLWASQPTKVTEKVLQFEKEGATVHVVSLDISASDAASKLLLALEQLSLPPVKGVVHAAGVLEDQFLMTSDRGAFDRVLAPKIKGAMSLNEAFPPNTLDFFVLFSSCGQHFQFAGSASYASGNSFLDSLAKRRRDLGDNTIAFQWTCWRNLGMAADADNLNAEMEIKGITDVTSEDAFKAWEYFTNWDMESAVIVRARPIAQGAILASPILADIVVRHAAPSSSSSGAPATATPAQGLPTSGPELSAYLSTVICSCVAKTLKINEEDIDPSVALSELGLDSVMTIQLRKHLQDALNVKVPPTLIWSHPSVGHIVKWFVGELAK